MSNAHKIKPKQWSLTPWQMNGQGGWTQQPIILVEGEKPFYDDHPDAYIAKLEELHDDVTIERRKFWTLIGEFKDALERYWNVEAPEDAKGHHSNGHRPRR